MPSVIVSLEGKVALVTGAGRGLGRAMAAALCDAGASVVAAGRTISELDSFVAEATQSGGLATAVPADITDEGDVHRLVETALPYLWPGRRAD